jgi:succinoglycan biosynthesis protein ExoM
MRRGMILIPTFRRPQGLAKALSRLDALQIDADVSILVAENDPDGGQGTDIVRVLAPGHRFEIGCIDVAKRGVSAVRDALFAAALAVPEVEFVALLDDDEWPEPQWLQELLAMQQRTGADIVGGTLLPAFATSAPAWAACFELYRQEQPDGPSDMVWGTCNALLTRAILERTGPVWFDPALGLTGGEDMEFFARAKAIGARFAWAAAAVLHEDVPESRVRPDWIFRRSFRIGSTNALVQLRWRYGHLGRPVVLAKALGRLGLAAAAGLRGLASSGRRMEALSLAARSLGEIAGLLGLRYREYGSAPATSGEGSEADPSFGRGGALASKAILQRTE